MVHSTAGMNVDTTTVCRAPSSASAYVEVRPVDVRAALHEIQICRSAVSFHDVLLDGRYLIFRCLYTVRENQCHFSHCFLSVHVTVKVINVRIYCLSKLRFTVFSYRYAYRFQLELQPTDIKNRDAEVND